MAYKAEQRRRFKAVLCREPDVALSDKHSESKRYSKSRKVNGSETRRKLDGIYLVNCIFYKKYMMSIYRTRNRG